MVASENDLRRPSNTNLDEDDRILARTGMNGLDPDSRAHSSRASTVFGLSGWRHLCATCLGHSGLLCSCGWIPKPVRDETKALLSMSWPVILTIFMQFFLTELDLLFCGHIGKVELDAAGLAISFTNVTGLSVGVGLATACDTLISQAYGGKNFYKVGITIQKGILVLSLAMFPIWAIWLNAESFLLFLNQDPDVASVAGVFCKILTIGLPGNFLYTLLRRFLQNQGVVRPLVVVGLVVVLSSALAHYITVFALDLGIFGAAGALVFSQLLQPVVCLAVIRYKGLVRKTWNGWSWESLCGWWMFLQLAIPSALMICMEWWSFEVISLIAGIISDADLAASIIIFQVMVTLFMVPIGMAVSAGIRIGTFLGANRPTCARRVARVGICLTAMWALFTSLLLFVLRSYVGYIFSSDKDVVDLVMKTMPVLCVLVILDFMQGSCQGVYRGSGRQKTGALLNFLGCYVVALPIGVSLAFVTKKGVMGLWIGMCCGLSVLCFGGLFIVLKFDWAGEAKKAQKRIGVLTLSLDDMSQDLDEQQGICLEVLDDCEQIEVSDTSDSTVLLTDSISEAKREDESVEAETTIDDESFDQSETRTLKFESEPGALLSSSQKKTLFIQRLLLFLAGVLIVVGAGIASNFKPFQDCHHCRPLSDVNSTYVSNCSAIPSATSVLHNVSGTCELLPVVTLPTIVPTLLSTISTHQSSSRHTSLVQPQPSPVLKLSRSSQTVDQQSRGTRQ